MQFHMPKDEQLWQESNASNSQYGFPKLSAKAATHALAGMQGECEGSFKCADKATFSQIVVKLSICTPKRATCARFGDNFPQKQKNLAGFASFVV